MPSERHIVLFHGTTDAFLHGILDEGLVPNPEHRPSHLGKDGGANHLMSSLDGVYMASTRETSEWHARSAAAKFGGEPIMFVLRVPLDLLVPDEDEVNSMLNWPIYQALGYDDMEDYERLLFGDRAPWTFEVAMKAGSTLLGGGAAPDDVARLAGYLDAMIAPVCGKDWNRDPDYFHPEAQAGWNCPNWMVELDRSEAGRAIYRENMDSLCRLLAGMDPDDYPCGLDACRGRVVEPIQIDGPDHRVVVVGYGLLDDPFGYLRRTEAIDGSEIVHPCEAVGGFLSAAAF
jgi:hypothetical protein